MALLQRLYSNGVKITPCTRIKKVSGNTVTVANVFTDEDRDINGIDTVVFSYGGVENNNLFYALKGQIKELHAVGDCKGVRKILWAVNDGANIGRAI